VVAHAAVSGAQARAATATVVVDTAPPAPTAVAVTPAVFSPNGDGYGDRARLRFTLPEAATARVRVVDGDGVVLGVVSAWRTGPAGERSVFWDGRIAPSGTTVDAPEGKALLAVDAKDAAGNRATRIATAYVDRTLGFLRVRPGTVSPNGDGVQDQGTIGFRLTRRATVELTVEWGEEVVRAVTSATYAAGAHSVVWDGLLTDGSRAPSGLYRVRASAASELGDVGATRWVRVDRYRPRLEAPVGVTAVYGKRAKVVFVARDPYSADVRVTATVRSRTGTKLATIDCGWVRAGVSTPVYWKPPARRTYTLRLTAVDRGGNPQYAATVTKITVR
jgi:flagellar hook assembly protein FlgD